MLPHTGFGRPAWLPISQLFQLSVDILGSSIPQEQGKSLKKSKCASLQPQLAIPVSTIVHVAGRCRSGVLRDELEWVKDQVSLLKVWALGTCL